MLCNHQPGTTAFGSACVPTGMLARVLAACSVAAWLTATAALPAAAAPPADAELFARLDANRDGQLTSGELPSEHRRLFERLLRKADGNRDQILSRDEFVAGLTPDPPQKLFEEKPSGELPGADAIRWLLLSMDTDGDGSITASEVPDRLRPTFQSLIEPIDRNKNGVLDRPELTQGNNRLSNIATRVAQQQQVNVAAELEKLKAALGPSFDRFEGRRGGPQEFGLDNPRQTRQTFARLDANGDGQLLPAEAPEPLRPAIQQLLRLADRDRNGGLSEEEFIAGSRQLGGRRGGRGRRAGANSVLDALRAAGAGDSSGSAEGDAMDATDAMPGGSMPAGKAPGGGR